MPASVFNGMSNFGATPRVTMTLSASGAIGSALGSAIGSSSGTSRVSSGSVDLSGTVASGSDEGRGAASGPAAAEREYELLLGACLADGVRTPS